MSFTTGGRKPLRQQFEINGGIEPSVAMPANVQLDDQSANVQAHAPDADRELRMPASNRDGVLFWIINRQVITHSILLKDSTGADIASTIPGPKVAPTSVALVGCIGGTWTLLGTWSATL